MNTIREILKQLSRQGLLTGHDSLHEAARLSASDMLTSTARMAMQHEEEYRAQLKRLADGYGLSAIAKDLEQQDLAARLALSVTYRNMTGHDLWNNAALASEMDLRKKIEEIASPSLGILGALSDTNIPQNILQYIDQLSVEDGLIGEFAYSDEYEEDPASEKGDGNIHDEVLSRIVRVDYIPQRLFDAIKNEPELMRGLKPRQFEEFTASLLERLGYRGIQLTPRSGDGGRDVVATMMVNNVPIIMAFECKRYSTSNKIGPDILRMLLGTITHARTRADVGVLVTTSSFTSGARSFMAAEAAIDGKDFNDLANWMARIRSD